MSTATHLLGLIRKTIPSIHNEGHLYILVSAFVSLLLGQYSDHIGWLGLIVTLWMVYFFRDPNRVVPEGEGLVVSPADGLVSLIDHNISAPEELGLNDQTFNRVSIFLNVFDVHVQRAPIAGMIDRLNYRPGKFLSADLDKASQDNERYSTVIETKDGQTIISVQIAGLVARRIICNLREKQEIGTGERYGIIKFGSRVDVYLPPNIEPQVALGQRVLAGESILADLSRPELTQRQGQSL